MNHPKPTRRDFAWYYLPLEWLLLGLSSLPMPVLYLVADGFYLLMRYVLRYRHQVVFGNIRNSFPDKPEAWVRDTAHGFYRHFADTIVEILKMATISPAEFNRRVVITNPELGDAYFAKGRTIMTLGSHHGNWEWIAPTGAQRWPGKVDGVYKPLSNPFFEYFVYRLRTRLGTGLIPMRETLRDMEANRGQVRSLCMLSDQCPPKSKYAYWTRTLNQDTAFFTGSDRLAVQYNCPVLYASIRKVRRGYCTITLEEIYDGSAELNLAEHPITEAFARRIERDIMERPSEYLWSHRRWKLQKS
ncbi:lauroyl acyltransferase [Hymenobacter oligotrophus]|uniref:Lauroyl acyltransferase n=1 Tax=Hymenobacter oligotrophus TaxID=2319843 RepID=A0A3B7R185_9BACT|nr:lysophospholipid acyltransferase family protein [Hymenobacter oligotrophus]AYA37120.1 lauroyl acyltransferase [Hymenobacter oligotrophus]